MDSYSLKKHSWRFIRALLYILKLNQSELIFFVYIYIYIYIYIDRCIHKHVNVCVR